MEREQIHPREFEMAARYNDGQLEQTEIVRGWLIVMADGSEAVADVSTTPHSPERTAEMLDKADRFWPGHGEVREVARDVRISMTDWSWIACDRGMCCMNEGHEGDCDV